MIRRVKIDRFKSLSNLDLELGALTVLVGTNASGKSNIRDTFRFLHAEGRGYRLVDILGGKFEGGDAVWTGIRGGPANVLPEPDAHMRVEVFLGDHLKSVMRESNKLVFRTKIAESYKYWIELVEHNSSLRVVDEGLVEKKTPLFWTDTQGQSPRDVRNIKVQFRAGGNNKKGHVSNLQFDEPVLTQARDGLGDRRDREAARVLDGVEKIQSEFRSIRFLDLDPESLKAPSYLGQAIIGDRGQNLPSVIQAICEDTSRKRAITEWIQALTPMDVSDLEFPLDQLGRVSLTLVERDGRRTGVASASDGTLRFLGFLALVFSEETSRLCFIEEIDNGIHPTRLHLLVELLQTQASTQRLQIVATSHSPILLRMLDAEILKQSYLVYRHPDSDLSEAVALGDLPNFTDLVGTRDPARLMESGWFENTIVALKSEDEIEDER